MVHGLETINRMNSEAMSKFEDEITTHEITNWTIDLTQICAMQKTDDTIYIIHRQGAEIVIRRDVHLGNNKGWVSYSIEDFDAAFKKLRTAWVHYLVTVVVDNTSAR